MPNNVALRDQVRNKVIQLSREFMPDSSIEDDVERLVVIGSESIRAIEFILAIEDEFEIDIDDEFLNPEFFTDYDYISRAVTNGVNERKHHLEKQSRKAGGS